MKLIKINMTGKKLGQLKYAVVVKPVVVPIETVWNIP